MDNQNFKLKTDQPYITLNKVLQIKGIAQTGGHAKIIIQNNDVMVNGIVETRVRNKLIIGDIIQVNNISIEIT